MTHRCNRCYKAGVAPRKEVTKGRKVFGSVMMDVVCTCTFVVSRMANLNEIKVKLYPAHYNHDLGKLHKKHLKLPKVVKEEISGQLKAGVPRA